MPGQTRRSRRLVPLVGDMLFSVLSIPLSYTALDKWGKETDAGIIGFAICVMYAAMGAAHLFRAFRLREKSRAAFIANLVYGVAFMACVALVAIVGPTEAVLTAISLVFWATLLANRVLAIARRRKRWSIVLNVLAILVILLFSITVFEFISLLIVVLFASLSALISVMAVAFSRIKLDVLKEIVRKTYAAEIISGLLMLIVSFSYVLQFADEAFASFDDAL